MQATTRKPADKNPEATQAARATLDGLAAVGGYTIYSTSVAVWVEGAKATGPLADLLKARGWQWSGKREAFYLDLRRVQLPALKTAAVQTVSTTVAAPAPKQAKPAAKPARKSKSAGKSKSSKSKAPTFARSLAPESWGNGFANPGAQTGEHWELAYVKVQDDDTWFQAPASVRVPNSLTLRSTVQGFLPAGQKPRPLFKGYKMADVPAFASSIETREQVAARLGREPAPWGKD